MSTRNDGRVVYLASSQYDDALDVTGPLSVQTILARGIEAVIDHDTNEPITLGTIEVGKKLRPNYRHGRIILYATHRADGAYEAIRVT